MADLGQPTVNERATVNERGDNRYFFIHVMKTAGTTFCRELKGQFSDPEIYPCQGIDYESRTSVEGLESYIKIPRLLGLPPERRADVQVYTGHFPYWVCDAIEPGLVTMTLLRDPVERSVAALRHFKRDAPHRQHSLEQIYDDPFIYRFFVENHQTKVFSLAPADNEDAINCALTVDDARLATAQRNLAATDVVGLTESYPDFIADIRSRFGWWPAGVDLDRRENVSREGWTADDALRARIEADNAYDVQLYAYAQELVASRRQHRGSPDPA